LVWLLLLRLDLIAIMGREKRTLNIEGVSRRLKRDGGSAFGL
jgi:hypothetical protein